MRQLFILLFLLVTVTTATQAQTLLRVHLADNSRINISVNGRYFNKRGTTVTVGDLPPGRHYLKIFGVSYDRWGRVYDRLVFQGWVNTKPGMITNFLYDPHNRTMSAMTNPIDDSRGPAYAQNPTNGSYNDGPAYERPTPDADAPVTGSDDTRATPLQPGTPVASPVASGTLTEEASDKLKARVDAKTTDTEKLKYIKEALRKETLTTFQVSYMMDWFLFESTKVEFARWAYNITSDKEYYADLAAKFNYSSSKEELQQFLDSRR
ncbi:hypothetical protein GCM10023093_31960 [Nemorincola caseinilytica]|uniref:DUF4476 domain-containing protein n=1 Tax=Nemorincola caseinilytica TaxID=2054315 RepID=A0ABP8NTB8_9BACT